MVELFLFFCLDTCICNAYLAYKTYHTKKQTDPKLILDHHAFRATLAQEHSPVPSNKKRKHINTYPSLTNINRFNNEANHFPEKVGKSAYDNYKSRICAHCKSGKSIYVCPHVKLVCMLNVSSLIILLSDHFHHCLGHNK